MVNKKTRKVGSIEFAYWKQGLMDFSKAAERLDALR
jgi:hypothetical protein